MVPITALRYYFRKRQMNEYPTEETSPSRCALKRKLLGRLQRVFSLNDIRLLESREYPEDNTISVDATPTNAAMFFGLPNEIKFHMVSISEQSTACLIYKLLHYLYWNEALSGAERDKWFEKAAEDGDEIIA